MCPKCGKPADRPRQSYCRACHNAYRRKTRPKWSELSEREQQRGKCRAYTHLLIKRGTLTRGPCKECGGTENVEAHHLDYTKPRFVEWVCRRCHRSVHGITVYPETLPEQEDQGMSLGAVLQKWL